MSIASSIASFLDQVVFLFNGVPVITLDCSISETHSRESVPTEFETESGQTISDHIVVKPFNLHIQGLITDAPLNSLLSLGIGAATSIATALAPKPAVLGRAARAIAALPLFPNPFGPSANAYMQLLALQAAKYPFTVATSLHVYTNMWVKKLSVPRDSKSGSGLLFDLDLVQLILVTPIAVNIAQFAAADLAAAKANKGAQEAGGLNGAVAQAKAGVASASSLTGVAPP
jgi:hypothetical protein